MGDEEWLVSVKDVSQDKSDWLSGICTPEPVRTGKVGTAACPGSGDAIGRAAPDLLLVQRLLLESCLLRSASRRQGRRLGVSRDQKRFRTKGNRAWADPKSQGGPRPPWATCRYTRVAYMHFRN